MHGHNRWFDASGASRLSRVSILAAIGGALVLGAGAALGGIYAAQRRLMYFPDQHVPEPSSAGVPGAQVGHIHTADGLTLLAWYAPPAAAGNFVVLYLHGNAGNIGYRAPRLAALAEFGWGVMLPEYRGYGGNPGTPSEQGLLEDARATMAQLLAMGVIPEQILLWGESLGTGLAVQLATEQPVAGLLLESPYTSMTELARWHFPWLPVGFLLRDRFDSLAKIGAVRAPVLVMHGGRDTIVPPEMGRRLLAAAGAPGEVWEAAEGGHNNLAGLGIHVAAADFVHRRCIVVDAAKPPDH